MLPFIQKVIVVDEHDDQEEGEASPLICQGHAGNVSQVSEDERTLS